MKQNILPNTSLQMGETMCWFCQRLRKFPVILRTTTEPDRLVRVVSWKKYSFSNNHHFCLSTPSLLISIPFLHPPNSSFREGLSGQIKEELSVQLTQLTIDLSKIQCLLHSRSTIRICWDELMFDRVIIQENKFAFGWESMQKKKQFFQILFNKH